MTLPEHRRCLIEDLRVIEDLHERMAAVVDRGRSLPPLSAEDRVPANRVPGCVSEVYLVCALTGGRCRFGIDSGSALVKGLIGLYCELYSDREPTEIAADSVDLIAELDLALMITPNRTVGIRKARAVMGAFAAHSLNLHTNFP